MARIKRLPDDIVRRIAAGEVIERPASVVKELVENSLDAGARNIQVEIVEGGVRRIRVSDDGCGMEKEDLPLAVAPHATSKIESDADLLEIRTLGFRGEALASIGRISYMRIETRSQNSSSGWQITVRGGTVSSVSPCNHPYGTTVTVEQLFFNLPARRRFLRNAPTETAKVTSTITTIAIPNHTVGFSFFVDGRLSIKAEQGASLQERLRQLFPGLQEIEVLLEGQGSHESVVVHILVSPPFLSRRDTRLQFFFVNGRPVRNDTLKKALRDSFTDKLPSGRNPVAFVFVTVPPQQVDVNVHPAKQEVRFHKPGFVYTAVRNAVEKALSAARHLTSVSHPTAQFQEDIRHAIADFLSSQPSSQTPQKRLSLTPHEKRTDRSFQAPLIPVGKFMTVGNTFIVVETDDGLAVIDQHALHERLIYDSLRGEIARRRLSSQRLLIPLLLDVSAEELVVFQHNRKLFEQLGFNVEVDGTTLKARAVPDVLGNEKDAVEALREILGGLVEEVGGGFSDKMDMALKSIACKAAVKAGEPLAEEELVWLLSEARRCATPITCPHGRPMVRFFSLEEMGRWFKR